MSVPRRKFLRRALSCASYLAAGLTLLPSGARRAFAATPRGRLVAEEDFARIEALADGVWAVVSTPLKNGGRHFATTSNGGIVSGRDGVLVVEAYYTEEGSAWLARKARALTGREPTHVVLTHYHADHTAGLGGLSTGRPEEAPALRALCTPTTRARLLEKEHSALPEAGIEDEGEGLRIDLGGRSVRVVPRLGHTSSDVTIELDEPRVVWCGDLVWNRMFPNYVDAIPSHLTRHCEALLSEGGAVLVPGHGDAADSAGLAPYLGLVRDIERAARRAVEQGVPAGQAAAAYRLPESLGDWTMFGKDYFERAFVAWERELGATRGESG